jgi:hypothetical protein
MTSEHDARIVVALEQLAAALTRLAVVAEKGN